MFDKYVNAASLQDAIKILAEEKSSARIIAGATDLMLEMERGSRKGIRTLIDISRAKDVAQIAMDEDGWIHIGPMVTHNQAAGSKLIREFGFPLALACWQVGSPQIRNRGTIAGNLITASPANDTIPPLVALDAVLTLASDRGTRKVRLNEFYLGVRKTVLAEDEALVDISFPAMTGSAKGIFIKSALRQAQAISVVNAAVILKMDKNVIEDAAIALGSVAPVISRASAMEEFLRGKTLGDEVIQAAARMVSSLIKPISDLRGSDEYRLSAARTSIEQALTALEMNTQDDLLPVDPIFLQASPPFEIRTIPETKIYENSSSVRLKVNGADFTATGKDYPNLLRFVRDEIGLTGSKEGCAEGECGACTIILDGAAVMACLVPVFRADGSAIETIEGVQAKDGSLHPVQEAFIQEGAVQCGYCTPGFILSAKKLLEEKSDPSREQIKQALTGNLCRCTGYYQIVNAVEKASLKVR